MTMLYWLLCLAFLYPTLSIFYLLSDSCSFEVRLNRYEKNCKAGKSSPLYLWYFSPALILQPR